MSKGMSRPLNDLLGKQLKRDVFNKMGVLVAPAAALLDHMLLRILEAQGINLTDEDVQSLPRAEGRPKKKEQVLVEESVEKITDIFQEIFHTKQIPMNTIQEQVIPKILQATDHPNLFVLFSSLQAKDDYTYRHNIGVGVISTMLGRWLGLKDRELSELSVAATLHDVGKMKIPLDILNKPGKLTAAEFDLMKKHTLFGYDMIKATAGTNHRQALVALQHHERQDGSGYPYGVEAGKIDFHSRIVAVADVFHAMTSKRAYRDAAPFYMTLREIYQNGFGELDAKIVYVFLAKMMQSLVGNEVLLTDGRRGHIIMIHPHDPMNPLVSFGEETFLDLSKEPSLKIDQVIV